MCYDGAWVSACRDPGLCKHGQSELLCCLRCPRLAFQVSPAFGDRRGQVLLATVNEATMVPFVSQQLNNLDLALALAKRGNLPGAGALVSDQFERLFQSGQYKEAAEAAAESPQVCWRCGNGLLQ
jgi:hypothetical protein